MSPIKKYQQENHKKGTTYETHGETQITRFTQREVRKSEITGIDGEIDGNIFYTGNHLKLHFYRK